MLPQKKDTVMNKAEYQSKWLKNDKKLRDIYKVVAHDLNIDPYLLYTNSMNEGMEIIMGNLYKGNKIGDVIQQKGDVQTDEKYDINNYERAKFDNFGYTGLDSWGHRVKEMRDKGALPEWFKENSHYQFTGGTVTNESGLQSPEVLFPNMYTALIAQGAFLKMISNGRNNPKDIYAEFIGGKRGGLRAPAQKAAEDRYKIYQYIKKQNLFEE